MDAFAGYQRRLLNQAQRIYRETQISAATVDAFLAVPRHLFIQRYREWASKEWCDVTEENLHQHLATLYADSPVILSGEDDDNVRSTISQPSFVLRMLDLLQLRPGHSVLELGTGSGWNAALIGQLVGPGGRVARRPFWWGGKGRAWFSWQTAGIRSFLGVTEPKFRQARISGW